MADEPNFGATETTNAPSGYISREQLDEILAARDAKHAEEMAQARSRIPVAQVAMHGGGPGIDQHQVSWNLAEQEAARRGESLDHWTVRD